MDVLLHHCSNVWRIVDIVGRVGGRPR